MSKQQYLTAPVASKGIPKGIPYIVGNEAAERFSYYGMRAILVIFLTQYLRDASGELAPLSDAEAKSIYHYFLTAAYFFPVLGAFISDLWLGKYRTIIWLSIVYCIGHLILAIFETKEGVMWGLGFIALGAGGIKPCVSAHVGDQFGKSNQHLFSKVFGWFYFSINFGAFISTLLTPWLLRQEMFGPHVAFGVPGLLMLLATIVFWMGRHKFVHIPADPVGFKRELFAGIGLQALFKLGLLYAFIAVFWAVYDQNGSDWVLQAENMDRSFLGITWDAAQIQALNPVLVLFFIPLLSYLIYPFVDRFWKVTASRKIAVGMLLILPVLAVIIHVQSMIDAGQTPSIRWHVLAFALLTAAEVMIYQTGLEYSYTQAPKALKSFMMSLYLLSISIGNLFTAQVNKYVVKMEESGNPMTKIEYFSFFQKIVLVSVILFIIVAAFGVFKEKNYLQDEVPKDS